MQSIREIVSAPLVSPYRGSEATYEMVKEQIRERWGEESAEEFDPATDAMPFGSWAAFGFRVRKGEKALKSVTFIEVRDESDKIVRKVRRTVNLFHKRQVEKIA